MSNLNPISKSQFKNTIICIKRSNLRINDIASKYFGLPEPRVHITYQGVFFGLVYDMSRAMSFMTISDMFDFITELKLEIKDPHSLCVYF